MRYGGTLFFWFWSGTNTYDFDNLNRIRRSKHRGTQIRVRIRSQTWTRCFLPFHFDCHFHLFMPLSTSRAWIRYSSAGSSSLANHWTSHGARAHCECIGVGMLFLSSACDHMCMHECMWEFISTERNGIKPILLHEWSCVWVLSQRNGLLYLLQNILKIAILRLFVRVA